MAPPRSFLIRSLQLSFLLLPLSLAPGQSESSSPASSAEAPGLRGSLMEDRAAKRLLNAGDARLEADEPDAALDIWRSVIERYPRSRHRFEAHLRIGTHLLEHESATERARVHFDTAADPENPDDAMRAEATLNLGICFHRSRNHGKSFRILRDLIEEFPASEHVNSAHYYIGLGHFQLGHYRRAITALEKVGTAFSDDDQRFDRVEAGRRLYLKIDDLDLSILELGQTIPVEVTSESGDRETVECLPLGRSSSLALGSILTALGPPDPDNNKLEVRGGDRISVHYTDRHSAAGEFDKKRSDSVAVVGTAEARITDGSYSDDVDGVVIGKSLHIEVTDSDHSRTPGVDTLTAEVSVLRKKTDEEIERELGELLAAGAELPDQEGDREAEADEEEAEDPRNLIDPLRLIAVREVVLEETATDASEEADGPVASGVFRAIVPVQRRLDPATDDNALQASVGDIIRLYYLDEVNLAGEPAQLEAEARAIIGDLGDVRAARSEISDRELHLRTKLSTADALTQVGNHYRDFGLDQQAEVKYLEALDVAGDIEQEARKIGGPLLEETYVQLWRIYFAMERHQLAYTVTQRLLEEFPQSSYVDEAMLKQAEVAREQGEFARALEIFTTVSRLRRSPLRGEAQFGLATTYEQMALARPGAASESLFERAFTEYRKVYEQYPDSGRIGEAVAKMANFYYQKQDYQRAIDVFEGVFDDHPDAAFLDVILFNYGRCLYRLNRTREAQVKFDRLIAEYPESPLAAEAKQISDALKKTTS